MQKIDLDHNFHYECVQRRKSLVFFETFLDSILMCNQFSIRLAFNQLYTLIYSQENTLLYNVNADFLSIFKEY